MEHVLGQGRSPAHELKVGTAYPCSEETLWFQHKSGQSIDQAYLPVDSEFSQTANRGQVGQHKSSNSVPEAPWLGSMSGDGYYDELVKHMSNLPGFLQRVEKENSIQEKALNFGVLEWKRLEKWKYTERMPRNSTKKISSSSSNFVSTSGPPKMSSNLRNLPASHSRNPATFYPGKQALPRGPLFSSPPRKRPSRDRSHLNTEKEKRDASHHYEKKYGRPIELKGKETCNQEFHAARSSWIGRQNDHWDQRLQSGNRSSMTNGDKSKKYLNEEVMSGKQVLSPELGEHKSSGSAVNSINSSGRSEMQSHNELKFTTESCHAEPQNIVPPVTDHFGDNGCLESIQFMDSRTSVDGQFPEVAGYILSDFCPTWDFNSRELSSDRSHSCPLPSVTTVPIESAIEQHDMVTYTQALGSDIRTKACQRVNPSISLSGGKYSAMHKETTTSSSSTEASSKAPATIVEKPAVRTRASSPAHRFSFDLGKVGRSFSFKDNSTVGQWNSTDIFVKSGKSRQGVHSSVDRIARDEETPTGRARSSPLRRLLDPLLKHRGTESAEMAGPTSKSLYSMSVRTTSTKGASQDRKPEASVAQALLQLTWKNGRPCFKLVVNNREDMLAAGVKSLPMPGKSDPCMSYTFYSVHEIRKKGMNWITQGSKSKNYRLGYDIIGEMKISNFYHLKESGWGSSECEATECVLYGVNPGQADKQALEFTPSREIAAIVLKSSLTKIEPECGSAETLISEENKKTTVILPGDIHGIPIKGAPSSLISRWKSGGLCDCGGWDVGCKLRVLADHNKSNNGRHASALNVDRLQLSLQSGERKNKQAFSLEPLTNGLYSVEFNTSISLTEAFATCVAYVTCRKFPEITDMRGQSDAKNVPGADTEIHVRRTPIEVQEQSMSHPCPPLSPAGRI